MIQRGDHWRIFFNFVLYKILQFFHCCQAQLQLQPKLSWKLSLELVTFYMTTQPSTHPPTRRISGWRSSLQDGAMEWLYILWDTHPPACHLSFERLVSQIILIRYSPYIECRHIGLFGTVTFVLSTFVLYYNFILAHPTYISSVALPAQLVKLYFMDWLLKTIQGVASGKWQPPINPNPFTCHNLVLVKMAALVIKLKHSNTPHYVKRIKRMIGLLCHIKSYWSKTCVIFRQDK